MTAAIFDSHCHLDYIHRAFLENDAPENEAMAVLQRAAEAGVAALVNPSVTPARFGEVIALAERFPNVYAALAVHPTDVEDVADDAQWLDALERLLPHPKVVAIGETGLDYYRLTEGREAEEKAWQQRCFRQLLDVAVRHDLPVIIHDREAHEDVARFIAETPGVRGVMHCFSGDADFALQMIDRGFFISFAGNVTFKNAIKLQEAACVVPLEYLLVETDSPFLSPAPHRGQPNEPARVRHVVEKIAELKGLPYDTVAEATTANARRLFGLC